MGGQPDSPGEGRPSRPRSSPRNYISVGNAVRLCTGLYELAWKGSGYVSRGRPRFQFASPFAACFHRAGPIWGCRRMWGTSGAAPALWRPDRSGADDIPGPPPAPNETCASTLEHHSRQENNHLSTGKSCLCFHFTRGISKSLGIRISRMPG